MSAYPLTLEGSALRALVVGGGPVALRKVRALCEAGALVRVVAPQVHDDLRALEETSTVQVAQRRFTARDIGDAHLVIVATDDRALNSEIAARARALGRLVNVADAPDEGNCSTPATHRAGSLVIAVSAGGVPGVAARVRDELARDYEDGWAAAVEALGALRERLLDAGARDEWERASRELIGDGFADEVRAGVFAQRVVQWR